MIKTISTVHKVRARCPHCNGDDFIQYSMKDMQFQCKKCEKIWSTRVLGEYIDEMPLCEEDRMW
jgi:hypothetical protein